MVAVGWILHGAACVHAAGLFRYRSNDDRAIAPGRSGTSGCSATGRSPATGSGGDGAVARRARLPGSARRRRRVARGVQAATRPDRCAGGGGRRRPGPAGAYCRRVRRRDDGFAGAAGRRARLALSAAGRAHPDVAHRAAATIGTPIVQSTYRRGNQRITNPKHEEIRRTIRALDEKDDDIIATGDPTIDLIGIVAGGILNGIGSIWRGRAEAEARAELADTPASLVETVWEPYTYQVTTLEAERTGVLRAALVDRPLGRSWPLEQTVRERRRFKVAIGRVPKDRGLLEGQAGDLVTSADVAVWEQGGLRPSIRRLADALAALQQASAAGDVAAVTTAWAANPVRLTATSTGPADPEPTDEKVPVRRLAAQAGVEQVTSADGVRRYRLVEPAVGAGTMPAAVTADP